MGDHAEFKDHIEMQGVRRVTTSRCREYAERSGFDYTWAGTKLFAKRERTRPPDQARRSGRLLDARPLAYSRFRAIANHCRHPWPGPVPASNGTYVQEEMARQEARCITSAPLFHTP
jgi:hypothetical protein